MSDRYWSGQLAAVILGLICLVIVALGAWTAGYLSEQRQQTNRATRQFDGIVDEYIARACIGMDHPALIKCIADAKEISREDRRAEFDLRAQENMARWALWLLALSAITTVVTAVGIYYVRETLVASHRSTDIAQEIGVAQVRAYISISNVTFHRFNDKFSIHAAIGNSGNSPARNVQIDFAVYEMNMSPFGDFFLPTQINIPTDIPSLSESIQIYYDVENSQVFPFGGNTIGILIIVQNTNIFDERYLDSAEYYILGAGDVNIGERRSMLPRPPFMGSNRPRDGRVDRA